MRTLLGPFFAVALFVVGLVPSTAQAAWPKYIDFQTCWNYNCTGLNNTWTVRANGRFVDQFGSRGSWFFVNRYPVGAWTYSFDWLLVYDNGVTTYFGDLVGSRDLAGTALSYNFLPYPPYPPLVGAWCTSPDPVTGDCL